MKRIYDAEFSNNGDKHWHLKTFWWVEGSNRGIWSRLEAYNYVVAYPETVYVAESGDQVFVYAHHHKETGTKWIQTAADGKLPDNLITLAKRHR
jgi:hypothetical protein